MRAPLELPVSTTAALSARPAPLWLAIRDGLAAPRRLRLPALALSAAALCVGLAPAAQVQAATIVVTTADMLSQAGDGECSLAEAVANANANADLSDGDCAAGDDGLDRIEFDPVLHGSTITLDGEALSVVDVLEIDGPGAELLTLDGKYESRIIEADAPLTVRGLTFTRGISSEFGGAIRAYDDLTVEDSAFIYNEAGTGGAIAVLQYGSDVNLVGNVFVYNRGYGSGFIPGGGGVAVLASPESTTRIGGNHFDGNFAGLGGGLLMLRGGSSEDGAEQGIRFELEDNLFEHGYAFVGGGMALIAFGSDAGGGGLSMQGDIFSDNMAYLVGGGASLKYGATDGSVAIAIADATFSANSAKYGGGGIALDAGVALLERVDFDGNRVTSSPFDPGCNGGEGAYDDRRGGGLLTKYGGQLSIVGSTFSGNCSPGVGGGASIEARGLVIDGDTRFIGNQAGARGGGLDLALDGRDIDASIAATMHDNLASAGGGLSVFGRGSGEIRLHGATIRDNGAARGGGVFADAGALAADRRLALELVDSLVEANSADESGGGMLLRSEGVHEEYVYDEESESGEFVLYRDAGLDLRIVGSRISGNQAVAAGGGLRIEGRDFGQLSIAGSSISGNSAGGNGAAIDLVAEEEGELRGIDIAATTFAGNQAGASGGALALAFDGVIDSARLVNVTVHGNTAAADGGGILLTGDGELQIHFATISGQQAQGQGGGIAVLGAGVPRLRHAVVAENLASTGPDVAGSAQADFSLVGNEAGATLTGTGLLTGLDPLLGPLADNGGATLTRLPQPGSPLVDAGDPAFAPPPATDQRGQPRLLGDRPDIGAVEAPVAEEPPVLPNVAVDNPQATREAGLITFTVTLDAAFDAPLTYTYATVDGSAQAPAHYVASSGTLLFDVGQTQRTVGVNLVYDGLPAPDRSFVLDIRYEGVTVAQGTGTILGSDGDPVEPVLPAVQLQLGAGSISEAGGSMQISACIAAPAEAPVVATLAFAGTATFGVDYTVTDGDPGTDGIQIVIPPGQTCGAVTLTAIPDTLVEGNETVQISIAAVSGGVLGDSTTGVVTILDASQIAPEVIPTASWWILMLLGLLLPASVLARLRREG